MNEGAPTEAVGCILAERQETRTEILVQTPRSRRTMANRFFDLYPAFYATSSIGSHPNRLHERYRAIIDANAGAIQGCSVLDLASHDGRWSFAAHCAGARRVHGIEARPHLIERARATLAGHGVTPGQVTFTCGDAIQELSLLPAGQFDTALCLGFFYHTLHQAWLLLHLHRLGVERLILDTAISTLDFPGLEFRIDAVNDDAASISNVPQGKETALVGYPSRAGVEQLLSYHGFATTSSYDWRSAGITDWTAIEDYRDGSRITLTARRLGVSAVQRI